MASPSPVREFVLKKERKKIGRKTERERDREEGREGRGDGREGTSEDSILWPPKHSSATSQRTGDYVEQTEFPYIANGSLNNKL